MSAANANVMKALDAIFAATHRDDAPGLVVGVALHGQPLYCRAFGMASLEHAVANTPRTRMRLASVSKHMTCVAALLLAEDGKLDLDAPATAVLPELAGLEQPPTLRQLMQHTGGLRCNQELLYLTGGLAFQPPGAGVAIQFAQRGVNFAPGSSQIYCNGGYTLLSLAIERASGMRFEAFMQQRLFAPLGMHDTESLPSDMQLVRGIASFHQPTAEGGWRRGLTPLEDNKGEGAIVTTVDDMLRWMAHLRAPTKQFGSAALWQQLTTVATLAHGHVTPYALGLNRHRYRGVEVLQHGGSLMGAASQMLCVPEHGLDVIIMSNGALVNPVQMAWQVMEAVLADEVQGAPAALVAFERFQRLAGARYVAEDGMVFGFGEVAGFLGLSFLGSPCAPVLRDHGEWIGFDFHEAGMGRFEFRLADLAAAPDGGAPAVLPLHDAGQPRRLVRLPATPPRTASAVRALLGDFHAPELDAWARVTLDGQAATLGLQGPRGLRRFALEALSDRVFVLRGTDPQAPSFHSLVLQDAGFEITGARARRIGFVRAGAAAARGAA